MLHFIKNFVRDRDDTWICVRRCEFMTGQGPIRMKSGDRFSPGQTVNGVDFAREFDTIEPAPNGHA